MGQQEEQTVGGSRTEELEVWGRKGGLLNLEEETRSLLTGSSTRFAALQRQRADPECHRLTSDSASAPSKNFHLLMCPASS